MAHSIQTLKGRAESFNDLDLIAVLGLIEREVSRRPAEYEALRPRAAQWKRDLGGYGPGTIDLCLDESALSDQAQRDLRAVLSRLDDQLEQMGPKISAIVLNEVSGAPGVTFQDYPTSLLKDAVARLRALIA